MFGARVSERGGSYRECSVAPGPVVDAEWWRQEVGVRGAEAVGRSVVVEPVGEVAGWAGYGGLCE